MQKNKHLTLPPNTGQKLGLPGEALHAGMVRDFRINDDGTITISNWLMDQTYKWDKSSRAHAPHTTEFKEIAVAWFKRQMDYLIRKFYNKRTKGGHMTDHLKKDHDGKLGEVLERQLASQGFRVR